MLARATSDQPRCSLVTKTRQGGKMDNSGDSCLDDIRKRAYIEIDGLRGSHLCEDALPRRGKSLSNPRVILRLRQHFSVHPVNRTVTEYDLLPATLDTTDFSAGWKSRWSKFDRASSRGTGASALSVSRFASSR